MALLHGGDWAGYQKEYGDLPLDFSANISPLGLPEGVKAAIIAALSQADRYPDPLCRTLCGKLAEYYGVAPHNILCGNGAADLLFRLTLAKHPRTALITSPTFAEYQRALELAGCEVRFYLLSPENDFLVTDHILRQLTPELEMLILCEPNNPTGKTTPRPLLKKILQTCETNNTLLVMDECFNDLLDEPEKHSLQDEVTAHGNLLLLKAFTKSYAMAGIRLGYALCGNPALLETMRRAGQPWAVSVLAQAAGLAALEETDYSAQLHTLLREERPRLKRGLEQLGCAVTPGEANYLLFYHRDTELVDKLRRKGILLRDCANYAGLFPGYYRAAVRTKTENDRLLQALREVLNG